MACGQAFWALEGVVHHAPDAAALTSLLAQPQNLRFDATARAALLTYLDRVCYPRYPVADPRVQQANAALIGAKL